MPLMTWTEHGLTITADIGKTNENRLPPVDHIKGTISTTSQFEIGDEVILDAGQSGDWGPGTITAKVEFDDGYEGYYIDFPITQEKSFGLGWIGPSILEPASDSDDIPLI